MFGIRKEFNSSTLSQPGRPKVEQGLAAAENAPPPPPPPRRPKRIKLQELIRKTGKMTMALDRSMLKEAAEKSMGVEQPVDIKPDSTPEELLAWALSLAREQKVRESLKVGEAAEERGLSKEQAFDLWTELGNACYDLNYMSMAAKSFRKCYDINPSVLSSVFNLGVALHCMNDLDEAQRFYEKGEQIEPEHPKLCCNLGVIHFQKDRFEESEKFMRRAIEGRQDYVRAWDNLASTLGAQSRADEAVAACEKAIELNPDCLEAWFKIGLIRFDSENYEAAKLAFLHCRELEICRAYIDYHLGMIACQEWNEEEAEKYFREACLKDRYCPVGPEAWMELGDFFKVQGKDDKAKMAYRVSADLEKSLKLPEHLQTQREAKDFGIVS
ncbi:MAG: tetratricopeptide repeat protein [Blastochloris sp.]|nr:tetratricopeptide repeat protein [Blastochloris sp.]